VRLEREQVFALGVGLGMLLGVAVGSLVAARLSDEAIELLHRIGARLGGHDQRLDFEALLQ
jgi:hypothetical protein